MARELWYVVVTKENKEFLINTLFNYPNLLHEAMNEGAVVGISRITSEFRDRYGWDRKKRDYWENEITLDEMCKKLNIVNPFKEFELPEKWCIKNSPENSQVIRQWFEKETKRSPVDVNHNTYWHFPAIKSRCTTRMHAKNDYVEITFEQFEKYVLLKKKEPQMNLEFTEFLNPTNSTLYRMLEQSDDRVFDTTGHSRSLDYAFMFYKVVEVIKHFNGKSESFRRGKVAQVINAMSITKGVIYDIFAENGEWYVKLKGHGKYLIKDVKITSVNEALFTIDDIIKAFEQNGVSEQFTRNTLVKYFKG